MAENLGKGAAFVAGEPGVKMLGKPLNSNVRTESPVSSRPTYDLTNFTKDDMYNCAIALRNMDAGAKSMEQVANRIVRYLYENFVDSRTGKSACALVRFFKTHPYGELTEELQDAACKIEVATGWDSIPVLVLIFPVIQTINWASSAAVHNSMPS